MSKQHAQLALFSDTDQQVREVVRLQAEHQQAVQQHATLQQQTTQLTAERTAWLEEQAQLRQQLQELQTVADVLAQADSAAGEPGQFTGIAHDALAQSQQELTQAQHTQQELWQQRQSAQTETQQWQERHTAAVQSLAETRAQQQAAAAGEALQQQLRSQIAQSTQESTAWRLLYEQAQHQQTTLQAQLTERDETVRQLEAAHAAGQVQEFGNSVRPWARPRKPSKLSNSKCKGPDGNTAVASAPGRSHASAGSPPRTTHSHGRRRSTGTNPR